MKNFYSNEEKARAALAATAGRVITDEDFRICVCGALAAGMERAEIAEFMKLSPKFGHEAITRINSFKPEANGAKSIGVGSLIEWAKQRGFVPCWRDDRLDHNQSQAKSVNLSTYSTYTAQAVSLSHYPSLASALPKLKKYDAQEVPNLYGDLSGPEQLKKWTSALFNKDGDLFQIVASYQGQGRRTQLLTLDEVLKAETISDIEELIQAPFTDKGAWAVINPVNDCNGRAESVSAYRYLLWESDKGTLEQQWGAIVQSQLPIAAVTSSGGKSLHAVIEIDARDAEEYADIAARVFFFLERHQADFDSACKNPNRLTRAAGLQRGEQMQSLIALREDLPNACENIADWLELQENQKPEPRKLLKYYTLNNRPAKKIQAPIIGSYIRPSSFTLIAGDSKTGKTWLMQSLAISAANGKQWLNNKIAPDADHPDGKPLRVFYVNTEVNEDVFNERLDEVAKSLGLYDFERGEIYNSSFLAHCPTRPIGETIDVWEDELIESVKRERAEIVIIDPMYMVLDGDENSVKEMRPFVKIIERIGEETKAAIIVTHHHKKGDMTANDIYNRISGSGIFTRAPDNIIDLSYIHSEWIAECGGINTYAKIDETNGEPKESAAGVRIEYMCRDAATPAPSYWWRCHAIWKKDAAGYLCNVWRNRKDYKPEAKTLDALQLLLDDCIAITAESQGLRQSRQQQQSNEDRIIDRLTLKGEPQTVQEIAMLSEVPESSVSRIISKLEERGKVKRTQKKDEKGRRHQAFYIG